MSNPFTYVGRAVLVHGPRCQPKHDTPIPQVVSGRSEYCSAQQAISMEAQPSCYCTPSTPLPPHPATAVASAAPGQRRRRLLLCLHSRPPPPPPPLRPVLFPASSTATTGRHRATSFCVALGHTTSCIASHVVGPDHVVLVRWARVRTQA